MRNIVWGGAVSLMLLVCGCKVSVDPKQGFYSCSGNQDCVDGYQCVETGPSARVCALPCQSTDQCTTADSVCDNGYCVPREDGNGGQTCTTNTQCSGNETFCDPVSNRCQDPCAFAICTNDQACLRDRNNSDGMRCVPCDSSSEATCGAGRACAGLRVNDSGDEEFMCAPTCQNRDTPCPREAFSDGMCTDASSQGGGRTLVCQSCGCTNPSAGTCVSMNRGTEIVYCNYTGELCDQGGDEDGDGKPNCDDADCIGQGACSNIEVCDDGRDNDSDGLCDMFDDGDCTGGQWYDLQPHDPDGVGGAQIFAPQPFVTNQIGSAGRQPTLVIDGDAIPWLAWADGNNLHVQRFDPAQCRFVGYNTTSDIINTPEGNVDAPTITLDGSGRVHFFFTGRVPGTPDTGDIYGGRINAGSVEAFATSLTNGSGLTTSGLNERVNATVVGSQILVTWLRGTGIYAKKWNGSGWGGEVTVVSGKSVGPPATQRIAATSDVVVAFSNVTDDQFGFATTDINAAPTFSPQYDEHAGNSSGLKHIALGYAPSGTLYAAYTSGNGPQEARLATLNTSTAALVSVPSDAAFVTVNEPKIAMAIDPVTSIPYLSVASQGPNAREIYVVTENLGALNLDPISFDNDGADDAVSPDIALGANGNYRRLCVTWEQAGEIGLRCKNLR